MKKLFFLFFLISCTSPSQNTVKNNQLFNFDNSLSFEEFSQLLIIYAETKPYPNIDE